MFAGVEVKFERLTLNDPIAPKTKITFKRFSVVIDDIQFKTGKAVGYLLLAHFLHTAASSVDKLATRTVKELANVGRIATLTISADEQGHESSTLNLSPLLAEKVSKGPYQLFNAADPNKPHILAHGKLMTQNEWEEVQAEAMDIAQEIEAHKAPKTILQLPQIESASSENAPSNLFLSSKTTETVAQSSEALMPKQKVQKSEARFSPHSREEIAKDEHAFQKKRHDKEILEQTLQRLHRFKLKDQILYSLHHEPIRTAKVK